jgi:CubicO group peptidase (beta-lactamase class C family)
LPGISIAIVARGDSPILYRSYGLASLDDQDLTKCTPVTEKTTFPVGSSILKNFVAMIIMQLQAENRLSLDDPLSKVLPDVPIQVGSLLG